jgi:hypothetical protein
MSLPGDEPVKSPPDLRLIDPRNGARLAPTEHPGYYPGFSTLAQQSFWDEATRRKVLDRVHKVPPIRFFSENEARLMQVICDHLLPQDDRMPSRRVPILARIDERLHKGLIPGYRFAKMPPDGIAYRRGFVALEQMAQKLRGRPFLELEWADQHAIFKSIHEAKPLPGAEEIWKEMPVHRFWALILGDCCEAYYAHPWAWDEIGFGGPAYPRGYMRLEKGEPEPWEVQEKRYEWAAPPEALSDPEKETAAHGDQAPAGQGGTH